MAVSFDINQLPSQGFNHRQNKKKNRMAFSEHMDGVGMEYNILQSKRSFQQISGFDEDTVEMLFSSYLENSIVIILQMKEALENMDFIGLKELSHRLKGVSGNLRVERIQYLSEELGACAKLEKFEECSSLIDQISTDFAALRNQNEDKTGINNIK